MSEKWSSYKEAQLTTENWRKFLIEGKQVHQAEGEIEALVERYRGMLHEGKISEAQLQEGIKDEIHSLLKRYGKKAMMLALAGTIGLGALTGAGTAYADEAPMDDVPVQQVDQSASTATTLDVTVPMRGSLQSSMDRAGEQARLEGAAKLNTSPENVNVQRTDVQRGSGTVTVSFNVSVK